ncbi:udp-glycosyltransferase 83a1, partial [Quercus suber]
TSLVSISQHQFDQIALGLELAGRPFLWVIKSDLTKGVGLPLKKDDNGIITNHEIKGKIDELFSDDDIRANSLKLKNMARESVGKGGSSTKNLEYFIEQIKH